jgi:hypothetical protein
MFVSIKTYKVKDGKVSNILEKASLSFYPLVQKLEGFGQYYVLKNGDSITSVSIFETQKTGAAANILAIEWMIDNAKEYMDGKTEIVTGIPFIEL